MQSKMNIVRLSACPVFLFLNLFVWLSVCLFCYLPSVSLSWTIFCVFFSLHSVHSIASPRIWIWQSITFLTCLSDCQLVCIIIFQVFRSHGQFFCVFSLYIRSIPLLHRGSGYGRALRRPRAAAALGAEQTSSHQRHDQRSQHSRGPPPSVKYFNSYCSLCPRSSNAFT